MGWTVLYIAFGVVALWLLGEVLLQYKARLRWRLLAFTGFLGVVAGALIPSIVVIGIGIAAFATGQTFVTLSYRRGFSTGWALGGKPGSSRRRRPEGPEAAEAPDSDPAPQVSEVEADGPEKGGDTHTFEFAGYREPEGYDAQSGYPTAGDSGYDTYAGYDYGSQDGYAESYGYDAVPAQSPYGDQYEGYGDVPYQPAAEFTYDAYGNAYDAYGNAYDPQGYPVGQMPYGQGESGYGTDGYHYGYGADGSDGYGGVYSDPYGYAAASPGTYTGSYTGQEASYSDTPPGGIFFPQQRDPQAPVPPEHQPQPYDYGHYYDEQRGY